MGWDEELEAALEKGTEHHPYGAVHAMREHGAIHALSVHGALEPFPGARVPLNRMCLSVWPHSRICLKATELQSYKAA